MVMVYQKLRIFDIIWLDWALKFLPVLLSWDDKWEMYEVANLSVSILESFLSTGSVGISVRKAVKAILTLEEKET